MALSSAFKSASKGALKNTTALALSFLLLSCRGDVDELGIRMEVEEKTLSNGLRILVVEDNTVPVVSYQTWFKVGSVDERPGKTGLAHLFEHLMFKGTEKYGPKQFFAQLEAKGAQLNAVTSRDYTSYYENFTPNLLPKVIEMEADRLANLKLTEKDLETERKVVFEERRLRVDNSPSGKIQEALWGLAYQRHPYGNPVIGYPQDLLALTLEDLKAFFASYYSPSNATIVVVGDVKADDVFSLIKKAYGGIPPSKVPERSFPVEPKQNGERRLRLYDHVASEMFAHAYHVTAASEYDSYVLDVLSNILFRGGSSRAYRSLVEDSDLLSYISGSNYTPTYPGLLMVSGAMKGDLGAPKGEAALQEVINTVQEKGVTDHEIKRAVRQLTVEMVDSIRTPYGLAKLLGTIHMVFGEHDRFRKDLAKYSKVTADEVKAAARKYLHPNNRSVVLMIPQAKKKTDDGSKK